MANEKQIDKAYKQIAQHARQLLDGAEGNIERTDPEAFIITTNEHIVAIQAALETIKKNLKPRRF